MTMLAETPATKADLADLREELRTHYATKADVAQLDTRIAQLEVRLIRWVVSTGLAAAVLGAAFVKVAEVLLN